MDLKVGVERGEGAETGLPARYRFNAREYHRMGEAGIFDEDDRVELIEGDIIQMAPIGDWRVISVNRLTTVFYERLPGRVVVSVQNPVRLASGSEPQPDLVLVRPPATSALVPANVLLLIEVTDTTLGYDRDTKMPLYAAAGIPEVWILDRRADRLRVYRDPENSEYRVAQILGRDAEIAPLAFPDLILSVDEVLG